MADRAYLDRLTRELANKGKLIEAGWVAMRLLAIRPDAPADQLDEMRMAFMAGAQHLYASIMATLDPGSEPSEADLSRMQLIHDELEAFRQELELRVARPAGGG